MFATGLQRWGYKNIVKPIFFKLDPEQVHDHVTSVGEVIGNISFTRKLAKKMYSYEHSMLEQTVNGIQFKNPVGLTAGFDKNAHLTNIVPCVGFGFEEIGSITGEPCAGNPKPRLWRLPKSEGLVVYYGLLNDGCEAIAKRLSGKVFDIPIGVSLAKTNSFETVDVDQGIADYTKAFEVMKDVGDYITINVSCPNTFGGEPFASPERLEKLLDRLDRIETQKPIFIKLAVDIKTNELDDLVAVMDRHRVHGVILSNLTKKRTRITIDQKEIEGIEKGGISGRPVYQPSNHLIWHLYKRAGDRYTIIGTGGIFTAEDAYEKIRCGASLVQLATGMIFQGPQVIGEINRGLVRLLKRDGLSSISDAVGAMHRM